MDSHTNKNAFCNACAAVSAMAVPGVSAQNMRTRSLRMSMRAMRKKSIIGR